MLVFSSLERKECPIKGSSARVARDEGIGCRAVWGCHNTDADPIAHLRLAEGKGAP